MMKETISAKNRVLSFSIVRGEGTEGTNTVYTALLLQEDTKTGDVKAKLTLENFGESENLKIATYRKAELEPLPAWERLTIEFSKEALESILRLIDKAGRKLIKGDL